MLNRHADEAVERLLADPYSTDTGSPAEAVTFVRALPAAVAVLPDPALESEIVPALAGAARSATLEASQRATTTMAAAPSAAAPRWRLRVAVLAGAVALLPVIMAGLAYAGVELPEAVDEAFESAGVDLPNQSEARGVPAGAFDEKGRGEGGKKTSQDAAGTESTGEGPTTSDDQGSNGKGKPDHAGPEATPPGQGGTPPGQGGVPPGNAGVPPGGGSDGSTGPPPEASPPVTPPGQGGVPPGQGGTPPGQAKP